MTSDPTDGPQEIRERIAAAVRRVDRGGGVLIVTDMLGDTQTNLSLAVARETGAQVVAGVNMPMLIKLSSVRQEMDARRRWRSSSGATARSTSSASPAP